MQLRQQRALDRFGNACLVLTNAHSCHADSSVSIRLQDYTDVDIASLIDESSSDQQDFFANIRNKLSLVQNELLASASPGTNVSLYRRHWMQTNSTIEAPINKNHSKQQISFTAAQFNMLARGLSSGPSPLFPTPFLPDDHCDGTYGGFTHLKHPRLVLDYHRVRKWRLLHVLLGGGMRSNDDNHLSDITGSGFNERDTMQFHPPFDILGLQEVDDYHSFWQPLLLGEDRKSKLGSQSAPKNSKTFANYQGVFQPKPNSPCVKFGWYSDGVALLWNSQKFNTIAQLQRQHHSNSDQLPCDTQNVWIEMGSFEGTVPCDNIALDEPARIAARNQVYIIVPLQVTGSKKIVIAATTHLKAKQGVVNERIRHLQALELKRRVHLIALTLQSCDWKDISIVILGDFNSEHTDSAVQSILQQENDSDWEIESAYPADSTHYTTWKARNNVPVCRAIDYIFYSTHSKKPQQKEQQASQCLQCTEILSIPEKEAVDELLPGLKYPSDHFLMAAKFGYVS